MGRKVSEEAMEYEHQNNDRPTDQETVLKFENKLAFVNAISQPMASKKLFKKLLKLVKLAKEHKDYLRFGLKDVQSRIRKGETGIVVFAGDVTPIDVMCHMPGVCEEKGIPYCYIPSKRDLALAVGFTTSCLMTLVRDHPDYHEMYEECHKEISKLGHPL